MISGHDLIEWGHTPGAWFGSALQQANARLAAGASLDDVRLMIAALAPPEVAQLPLQPEGAIGVRANILPNSAADEANIAGVMRAMAVLARVPTIRAAAVMPDACPAGIIPVGGVVAAENALHPGLHSADICCSVAFANLGRADPKQVLDRAMEVTHFGWGGRVGDQVQPMPEDIRARVAANPYLSRKPFPLDAHFATQGDGNHFLFVGRLRSTDEVCIVTHHGSRGPGATLYTAGMKDAERFRLALSPATPAGAGWLPADSTEGQNYWEALQILRDWTRASHRRIHDLVAQRVGHEIRDWFWNEHNFVFRRADGLYWHAKGATPGWAEYDRTLVPMNMAEPILITRGTGSVNGHGFLPHGAGRNVSRTRFLSANPDVAPPAGIDLRAYSGVHDRSELPQAYKSAAEVRAQMRHFDLAEILDEVLPYGSIMAGQQPPEPWRVKRMERRRATQQEAEPG